MSIYLTLNGQYIGVDPSPLHGKTGDAAFPVYHDRPAGGAWEAIEIAPHNDGAVYRFIAANRELSIQPDGTLQTRAAGTGGAWETLRRRGKVVDREGVPIALSLDGDIPPTTAPQPRSVGGFLRTQGADFMTEDGQPWLFAGYTAHTLIVEIAAGRSIVALLDEAISYGANTIVTIGCHLSQWKRDNGFYYDPRQNNYSIHLAALFSACADKGLRVAFAVLADAQGLRVGEQQTIWKSACDVARGRWNVLLRIGNEGPENGWRPEDFSRAPDLGGVLQTKGSAGGDTVPYLPPWDMAEYESRRDMPKALLDANCLELAYGGWDANPHGIKCPLVNIEPAFFHDVTPDMYGDSRWTDPRQAYRLGLQIGSGCAGGAFGASDGLVCRPLQPRAAECARQFFRGLRAGFVR